MAVRPLTENIPEYLKPYIVEQDASLYTAIDHASWRFILKIARAFFATHAHQKYLDGLRETGISTERIPLISEMDQCLRKFGWRAVAVSGFIPPAVFMEYLSLGILPIACDMRKIENLAYTPAPDIVHEAAGHAPIIADPEYSEYLRNYGEISQKAIYSRQDLEVYYAIRNLSVVKEDPRSSPGAVASAQKSLDVAIADVDYVTEATQLARMSWWTIEYGLVGHDTNPKIYGAGLLSSVGEGFQCLGPGVKKIPFSLDCIHMTYDITRPQPQLYVSPDFQTLTDVLSQFGDTLAFRRGGKEGLDKAIQAEVPTTSVLDSGIQISGTLTRYRVAAGRPIHLQFTGPTQLSYGNRELEGQGADYHTGGFGTPIGKLKDGRSPAELTETELKSMGPRLEFESGVVVEGKFVRSIRKDSKNLILVFNPCTVRLGSEILFQPEWGNFDMACGVSVTSVFGGAADRLKYLSITGGFSQAPGKPKSNLTAENRELNELYREVREIREGRASDDSHLFRIHRRLEKDFQDDWLLRYEILEILRGRNLSVPWESELRERLKTISASSAEAAELISRGLAAL